MRFWGNNCFISHEVQIQLLKLTLTTHTGSDRGKQLFYWQWKCQPQKKRTFINVLDILILQIIGPIKNILAASVSIAKKL